MDHGVTNSVYLIDPDGNLIEIYHDVPRAEYADLGQPVRFVRIDRGPARRRSVSPRAR